MIYWTYVSMNDISWINDLNINISSTKEEKEKLLENRLKFKDTLINVL